MKKPLGTFDHVRVATIRGDHCEWCSRKTRSLITGHDGACPIPWAVYFESEIKEWIAVMKLIAEGDDRGAAMACGALAVKR